MQRAGFSAGAAADAMVRCWGRSVARRTEQAAGSHAGRLGLVQPSPYFLLRAARMASMGFHPRPWWSSMPKDGR